MIFNVLNLEQERARRRPPAPPPIVASFCEIGAYGMRSWMAYARFLMNVPFLYGAAKE
jgi:hypothetical protein